MKGKFRILRRIGLGVFMVCALMVAFMPVAPVSAATEVTEVWVDFPIVSSPPNEHTESAGNIYIIHFKPTTAISRGVDTVTVTWPDGSAAMCGTASTARDFTVTSAAKDDVEFSTDFGTLGYSNATWYVLTGDGTVGGYRVKVTAPIDIAAGTDVWIRFVCDDVDTVITSCETAGVLYKVKVATSQDTTPVLSRAFALDAYDDLVTSFEVAPLVDTAGVTTQYIATFTDTTNLGAGDTVTLKFPLGTTMPDSIEITDVMFATSGGDFSNSTAATVDADLRTITGTTPIALTAAGSRMKIISGAGVANPQTATDACYWMLSTNEDALWVRSGTADDITAGAATQIIVANGELGIPGDQYSDDATMINMYSSQIWVAMADQYGNAKAVTGGVDISLAASPSGNFYWDDDEAAALVLAACETITAIVADPAVSGTGEGDQIVYFKDSTAGTHTLTFSADNYTNATWVINLAPAISLYDVNDNLVNTYGPTTSALAAELDITNVSGVSEPKYGVDYINDAITAAFAGDTVQLGDGIYEMDAAISLDKKITLTSVNGASSTTLRPTTTLSAGAIVVGADGTAANPIIIDDLTIQWLRNGTQIDVAVWNRGYDYVTVRNCIFNNIYPEHMGTHHYGGVVDYRVHSGIGGQVDNITSATVSNNTFNNCGSETWPQVSEGKTSIVNFDVYTGNNKYIKGVTISGNTFNDCNGHCIRLDGDGTDIGRYIGGTITDNTFTNGYSCILLQESIDTVSITGNTFTDPYAYAVKVQSGDDLSKYVTIKKNTITGCRGTYAIDIEHEPKDKGDSPTTYYQHYIQYNDFLDGKSYALRIRDADITASMIDCSYNYYGDATGPNYTALTGATVAKSNPNGTGDKVTDYCWYYPWLYKSQADVVADNVSWQTSVMKLVLGGWNTLSTPVPLIAEADTIDELISEDDMEIGYYYDGGWTQITTGYVLSPCDAVYVKMKSTASTAYVQLKFDCETFSTPSKDLAVGWNLISLASLASSGMYDEYAVASVYKDSANLPGYAQVISPSLNANRYDMYYNLGTSWAFSSGESHTNYMYAGLGYWIYMQNACTLAGFEITPIAPDLD